MNPWCIRTTPHWTQNPTRYRTFTVNFFSHPPITTVVTSTPAIARDWVYNLRRNHSSALHDGSLVVGLGVQWRPTFSSSPPEAATLQLCVESECLIFQLYHTPAVPTTLRRLLADDRITFVGVHNGLDRRLLEECQHELEVGPGMVDLAAEWGGNCSMERMAEELIGAEGVVKPRWIGMSNWEEYWLSNEQVEYACVDAYVSYLLAGVLGFPQFDDDDDDDDEEEEEEENDDEDEDGFYDDDGFYHLYYDEVDVDGFCNPYERNYHKHHLC